MPKEIDIGAYSAYAIAKEHGFVGTEAEWATVQAEAGANGQIAANAAMAAQNAQAGAEQAKTDAVNAKADALTAIEGAKNTAISAVTEQQEESVAVLQAESIVQQETIEGKVAQALESELSNYAQTVEKVSQLTEEMLTKAPAITCESSGSIVTVTDAAAQPAVSLISHIEPVQEGEGDPSPDNVRPISGWTQVNARNETSGQTLTADLPETVYGGLVKWNEGKILSDWRFADLGEYEWTAVGNGVFWALIAAANDHPGGNMVCTAYKTSTASNPESMADKSVWSKFFAFANGNIVVKDTRFTTGAELKAALNGVMLAFKTKTATEYQMTPQQLDMLKGTNNVWSDTGDTSLVYVADSKMYIDNKFAELQNAILAQGANI